MGYVESTKRHLTGLASKVIHRASTDAATRTLTIARPRDEVEKFWRDPDRLSEVLGDVANVQVLESGVYRWRFGSDSTWDTTLVEQQGRLRFVGSDSESELDLTFAVAPHDLGTEVTLRVHSPAPGLITGAAAFTALYRARALLQTGEAPTLAHNPSARTLARKSR